MTPLAIMEEPDQLASYAQYNEFFTMQQAIWQIISSPSFDVILNDQRRITLTPAKSPSLTILPAPFWWLLFFGGASFLLGVSAWTMRHGEAVTRVLAVSGMGFMLGAYSCAIYTSRELVMPAKLFRILAATNHLGIMVFAYAAVLFFWYYPKKLCSGPAAKLCVAGVSALWLNETMQWLSWPAHAFYAHFVLAYCLLLIFSYQQWQQTRLQPLQRAMLKWLLATMVLSLGFTVAVFYGPVILTGKPIASTVMTFCSVFLFYLGLVIGNIHYHQFDMEYWWIRAWQWLAFIFIALIADALFLYYLHLTDTASLALSIGVGGIYLLVRQWCWNRFSGNSHNALDRALPHLIETLLQPPQKSSPDSQWLQLIARVFNPLYVKVMPEPCETVMIANGGNTLHLPGMAGQAGIEAICCDRGNRLFTAGDAYLAQRLLELMRHSNDIVTAREHGMLDERRRIQRDLHDDVAARLLSLLHQTREPSIQKVAQNALRGLRDVIHLLGTAEMSLEEMVIEIEAGVREQLSGLGVPLQWYSSRQWPEIVMNSQQHINLRRIAREAIANALKHAHPQHVIVRIELENLGLCVSFSHDGNISDPATWIPGRGLLNIKSRVVEMGGSHKWVIEQTDDNRQYCQLTVRLPLPLSGKCERDTADRGL